MPAIKQELSVEEYVRRRNDILRSLDVLGYVGLMLEVEGALVKPDVALLVMHKARYEVFNMPPELRQESRKWLESRGYTRMYGLPWPAAGSLPESRK